MAIPEGKVEAVPVYKSYSEDEAVPVAVPECEGETVPLWKS